MNKFFQGASFFVCLDNFATAMIGKENIHVSEHPYVWLTGAGVFLFIAIFEVTFKASVRREK